jgi:hypothetical protein
MPIAALFLSALVQSNGGVVISRNGSRIRQEHGCLTVIDCVFMGLSSSHGGAIYFVNDTSEVVINGSSFLTCNASSLGGACYLSASFSLISHLMVTIARVRLTVRLFITPVRHQGMFLMSSRSFRVLDQKKELSHSTLK